LQHRDLVGSGDLAEDRDDQHRQLDETVDDSEVRVRP
jgi:hypothetical protein